MPDICIILWEMKATWRTLRQNDVMPLCDSIVKMEKCRNRCILVDKNNNNDNY